MKQLAWAYVPEYVNEAEYVTEEFILGNDTRLN